MSDNLLLPHDVCALLKGACESAFAPPPAQITDADFDGMWHLNEGSGATTADSSGNGYNASQFGAAQWVTPGKVGAAHMSDDNTWYWVVGNVLAYERTDKFSIACWVKTTQTNGQRGLVSKVDPGSSAHGYRFHSFQSGVTGPYFGMVGSSLDSSIQVSHGTAITDGAWHHLVVVYPGTSDATDVYMYLDGVKKTNLTIHNNTLADSTVGGTALWLAAYQGAASGNAFGGEMDEIGIYPGELSQANVDYLYGLG